MRCLKLKWHTLQRELFLQWEVLSGCVIIYKRIYFFIFIMFLWAQNQMKPQRQFSSDRQSFSSLTLPCTSLSNYTHKSVSPETYKHLNLLLWHCSAFSCCIALQPPPSCDSCSIWKAYSLLGGSLWGGKRSEPRRQTSMLCIFYIQI